VSCLTLMEHFEVAYERRGGIRRYPDDPLRWMWKAVVLLLRPGQLRLLREVFGRGLLRLRGKRTTGTPLLTVDRALEHLSAERQCRRSAAREHTLGALRLPEKGR
jgi:hypothetical protein